MQVRNAFIVLMVFLVVMPVWATECMNSIAELFNRLYEHEPAFVKQTMNTVQNWLEELCQYETLVIQTRGENRIPLSMPLLEDREAKLRVGKETIYFAYLALRH